MRPQTCGHTQSRSYGEAVKVGGYCLRSQQAFAGCLCGSVLCSPLNVTHAREFHKDMPGQRHAGWSHAWMVSRFCVEGPEGWLTLGQAGWSAECSSENGVLLRPTPVVLGGFQGHFPWCWDFWGWPLGLRTQPASAPHPALPLVLPPGGGAGPCVLGDVLELHAMCPIAWCSSWLIPGAFRSRFPGIAPDS